MFALIVLALVMALVVWPCASLLPRHPRVFVYQPPEHLKQHIKIAHGHGEGWARLTIELIMNSTYYEPDPLKADYFWIPGSGGDFRVIEWVIETFPYFNETARRGEARHVTMALRDNGAGEIDNRVAAPSYDPSSLNRSIIYLQQNGLADIYTFKKVHRDPTRRDCVVCFSPGVDIMIPTWPIAVCGPLCGYSIEQLREFSVWRGDFNKTLDKPHDSSWMEERRRHLVYFAGHRVPYSPSDAYSHMDGSGRGALYEVYKSDSRFAFSILESQPRLHNIDMFPHSDFCYSPLGVNRGDTDRYMGGMMFGCIPIMMNSTVLRPFHDTRVNIPSRLPFEEVVDWSLFSTLADEYRVDEVGKQLECLAPLIPQMRRAMSHTWTRLVWTRLHPHRTFLGESGKDDAFETLMQVLSSRIPNGYRPSNETKFKFMHLGWPCRDQVKWEFN